MAISCPTIKGLPDINCDQKLKISIFGDSFVRASPNQEQSTRVYADILKRKVAPGEVFSYGVPGWRSKRLLRLVQTSFKRLSVSKFGKSLVSSDIVIIDIGRNDFWDGLPAKQTTDNLFKIARLIRNRTWQSGNRPPDVWIGLLANSHRGPQQLFNTQVNKFLLSARSVPSLGLLSFDRIDTAFISNDRLHPSAEGYQELARITLDTLRESYK